MRVLAFAAVAVVAAGCGSTASERAAATAKPLAGNYVGQVEGTNALVAVVVGKDRAMVYVCDSEQVAQGFGGRASKGAMSLPALWGNGTADVRVAGGTATGTVTVDGVPRSFTARPAPATAGYFYAHGLLDGRAVTAHWVVAPSDEIRGAVIDRTTGDVIGFSPSGVHVEFDIRFVDVLVGDFRVPLSHLLPIHVEHTVQFPMPIDIFGPTGSY